MQDLYMDVLMSRRPGMAESDSISSATARDDAQEVQVSREVRMLEATGGNKGASRGDELDA